VKKKAIRQRLEADVKGNQLSWKDGTKSEVLQQYRNPGIEPLFDCPFRPIATARTRGLVDEVNGHDEHLEPC